MAPRSNALFIAPKSLINELRDIIFIQQLFEAGQSKPTIGYLIESVRIIWSAEKQSHRCAHRSQKTIHLLRSYLLSVKIG
jgi:hypothetical protein